MPSDELPRRLSLAELQERCAQETSRYLHGVRDEAWHCYEVFRRALVEKVNEAWDIIHDQYYNQMMRWVTQHPLFGSLEEEADFFINLAFEKFWRRNFSAIEFARFPDVRGLLAYVKVCIGSVMLDYARGQKRKIEGYYLDDDTTIKTPEKQDTYQESVEYHLEHEEFWKVIQSQLKDEIMFRVVYDSFVLGLKPVDILNQPPKVFSNIEEVYKIKAKALGILGRKLFNKGD